MTSGRLAPRFLGAAYLIVIATSLSAGILLSSATGSGSISDKMAGISANATAVRLSNLIEMGTTLGVVVMAVLLYRVLSGQNKDLALLALGLWLTEALMVPLARVGTSALIPLSRDFVAAGAPANSYYQTLGDFLYTGVYKLAYTFHMLFYCIGGLVWYGLFFRSRLVPRVISGYGFAAVSVSLGGIAAELLGFSVPMVVYVTILPFELAIGLWLVVRGIREPGPAVPDGQDQLGRGTSAAAASRA